MIDDSLNDTQQLTQSKGYQDALKEGMEAVAKQQEKKQMSVKELELTDTNGFKVKIHKKVDNEFEISVDCYMEQWYYLDRSQAHLLMLYLQKHLGYVSISKDRL